LVAFGSIVQLAYRDVELTLVIVTFGVSGTEIRSIIYIWLDEIHDKKDRKVVVGFSHTLLLELEWNGKIIIKVRGWHQGPGRRSSYTCG
jgi:hypothetical protein